MSREKDPHPLFNEKISRREALSRAAKIAIAAGVAAVAAGVGGYVGWQYLAKPKAKIRVVAIAHAAPGNL